MTALTPRFINVCDQCRLLRQTSNWDVYLCCDQPNDEPLNWVKARHGQFSMVSREGKMCLNIPQVMVIITEENGVNILKEMLTETIPPIWHDDLDQLITAMYEIGDLVFDAYRSRN